VLRRSRREATQEHRAADQGLWPVGRRDRDGPDRRLRGSAAPKARGASLRWPAIAAALVVAVLAAGVYVWHAGFASRLLGLSVAEDKLATAPRLSIVVLPFETGDPDQQFFADGIVDDLTTDLSHLPDSFVIARGTAFTYKGKPVDAKQIGRELGVRYMLEGSVRRVGENITVNAQLVSTETGAHVWAERFDGERSKLGELQVEFVARLANSLGVELVKAEALRAMRERPSNPDAVDLSMRGWGERYRDYTSKASQDATVSLFERALAIDPQLVPPMVSLARTLVDRVRLRHSVDPKSDIARAEDWAERAVAAEPDSSAAHMAKAWVFVQERQWVQAIAEAKTAVADDPNNPEAEAEARYWELFRGKSEDVFSGLETAFRLSPRDPLVPCTRFATSTPISRNGNKPSNGATRQSRAGRRIGMRSSTLPRPTPGPATTRRPKRPWRDCRKPIPASPCRHGWAYTFPMIRPSTRNTRASPKGSARLDCRRDDQPPAAGPSEDGFSQLQRLRCDVHRPLNVDSGRPLCANTGHSLTARRTGQIDPRTKPLAR
jgi:TolB-like protein